MPIGASGQKTRSRESNNQSFDQTASTRLSDRSWNMLNSRVGELGGQEYERLDPNAYRDYMDPYQDDVIAATTADINANRDKAANQQRSDLAGAGAFGDDRRDVMEAGLTGEYDRTLATTLAGLRSGGFRQAQGVAAGENSNRNQFNAMTQQQINQLLALLGQETETNTRGTSQGTTNRRGSSLGFTGSWSPSGGFG